jgi:hypothetical protein
LCGFIVCGGESADEVGSDISPAFTPFLFEGSLNLNKHSIKADTLEEIDEF